MGIVDQPLRPHASLAYNASMLTGLEVLVFEPDARVSALISRVLSRRGARVHTLAQAESGTQGLVSILVSGGPRGTVTCVLPKPFSVAALVSAVAESGGRAPEKQETSISRGFFGGRKRT